MLTQLMLNQLNIYYSSTIALLTFQPIHQNFGKKNHPHIYNQMIVINFIHLLILLLLSKSHLSTTQNHVLLLVMGDFIARS
jgi:hypothetical protein